MFPSIKAKLIEEIGKERDKYITKDAPNDKRGDELVQAAAATVGFFSEISHHRKDRKVKGEAVNVDKAALAIPDAPVLPQTSEEGASEPGPTPKGLAAAFLYRHSTPISTPPRPSQPLTTPVLIPQRRPNSRARGFAPPYAPLLTGFDISQNAFLDFIIALNASLEPSPYLNAINLASFAGEASPEPLIGFLIGEAVETVTDAIMEAQSRIKSNGFLDKVNEGFFAPRGLFAFVGTWRPNEGENEPVAALRVNEDAAASHSQGGVPKTAQSVAGNKMSPKDTWRNLQQQVQRAMDPAGGQFASVTSAPLTWPSAEEIAAATPGDKTKKKGRFDRAGLWMDEHVDKHPQITWTQEHPDHPLAGSLPKPEFRSRYADPSHAASSGDVVALLTGGQWHTKVDKKKKEKEVRKRLEKEKKKEKKLESKKEKARLEVEKSKAKAEAAKDDTSKANDNSEDTEAEQSKHKATDDAGNSSKERRVKENTRSGLSSLLEENLLYLVVVQHPSLTGST